MDKKIWLSSPHMGGNEINYVNDAFANNWIAPLGPNVNGFEQSLQDYTGVKYSAALSSGTAALHLALILLGVGRGDEVICQSFTFSASANPIKYCGATPIFIDSEKDTWNMSPELLRMALEDRKQKGKNVRAIIPVHLYGMPAKMMEINAIAAEYGVPVIEDAAEAMGSTLNNRATGSFGTIGILSFNGNKIITTSGGGALLSNDEDIVKNAKFLATQARDKAPHYQHSQVGYNYRLSNICAGIGRGQLEVLASRVESRRRNNERYREALKDFKGIKFQDEPSGFYSNYWLTAILIEPKNTNGNTNETLRAMLEEEDIESRPLWKPLHLQPIFAADPFYGDGTSESLFSKGLCLPSGSNLTDNEFDRILKVLSAL